METTHTFDLRELDALIAATADLRAIRDDVVRSLGDDGAHDIGHLLRVGVWVVRLAGDTFPARELLAAALLHDLVNEPKTSPRRAQASELSARSAASLLAERGFRPDEIERITAAIRDHSFSRGAVPQEPLARALQDADRLDAIGAIGILRAFSTGERMGSRHFDIHDPWATRRCLDEAAFTVDHFFTKLLLLPGKMLTDRGRREAERRVAHMQAFLSELGHEIGAAYPGHGTETREIA